MSQCFLQIQLLHVYRFNCFDSVFPSYVLSQGFLQIYLLYRFNRSNCVLTELTVQMDLTISSVIMIWSQDLYMHCGYQT